MQKVGMVVITILVVLFGYMVGLGLEEMRRNLESSRDSQRGVKRLLDAYHAPWDAR